MVEMNNFKIKYSLEFRAYFEPLVYSSIICFMLLRYSFVLKENQSYNIIILFGFVIMTFTTLYFSCALIRGFIGRFITITNRELVIPHEYFYFFDNRILKADIVSIEMPLGRLGHIVIKTKSDEFIIAPELVRSYGIEKLYEYLINWYSIY